MKREEKEEFKGKQAWQACKFLSIPDREREGNVGPISAARLLPGPGEDRMRCEDLKNQLLGLIELHRLGLWRYLEMMISPSVLLGRSGRLWALQHPVVARGDAIRIKGTMQKEILQTAECEKETV